MNTAAAEPASQPAARLVSLDAFRGATMLLMASAGLGFPEVAKHFPDSAVWQFLGRQTDHVTWAGCASWDLIQPAFMFMVGVALPFSLANRQARGQTFGPLFGHALLRSALLVVLAVFLTSAWSKRTDWIFTNVLAQIGLGYPFLFLIAFTRPRTVWIAAFAVLAAYWLAFALHPPPPDGFDWKSVGVPATWPHLAGFSAHWDKNHNFAAAFDVWFLNLFPRAAPFTHNAGGYQTLNFVPSLATMIFGLIAGRWLRSELPLPERIKRLVITGLALVLVGKALDVAGLCPLVKRIWTPAWALFSAGWVMLILAVFVAAVDWRGWKRWTSPLVVVGMNSIAIYCLFQLSSGFIRQQARTHLGTGFFTAFGDPFVPVLERGITLAVLWLVLFWMFRRRIFLRI